MNRSHDPGDGLNTAVALLETLQGRGVHLTVDGDRLRATAPEGILDPELRDAIRRLKGELITLLEAESGGPVRLSPGQERLWLFQQLDPTSTTYNITQVARVDGPLDADRLSGALDRVLERHEPLRSVVGTEHPGGTIRPGPVPPGVMTVVDLTGVPSSQRPEAARKRVQQEQQRPFDLSAEIPFRALLLRHSPESHEFVSTFHHMAVDGVSIQHFYRDLVTFYSGDEPPALRASYRDFAALERDAGVRESRRTFWRERLAGAPLVLDLPSDRPRGPVQSFSGGLVSADLGEDTFNRLKELARTERASLFMVLLGAFGATLHRYSGQRDLVVGTPLHGRHRPEFGELVGMFVNQLPLRMQVEGRTSLRALVRQAREVVLGSMTEHELPFGDIVDALGVTRDESRPPVFQVLLNVLPAVSLATGLQAGEVVFRLPEIEEMMARFDGESKFDLTLYALQYETDLKLALVYNNELFAPERMETFLGTLRALLALAGRPDVPMDDAVVPPAPRLGLEDGSDPLPAEGNTVVECFSTVAARHPHRPAVTDGEGSLTYGALQGEVDRVARLVDGASGGDRIRPVGVMVPHDRSIAVAILGVLRSGRPYVPLDPAYPEERLRTMAEDSGLAVILTRGALAARARAVVPAEVTVVSLEDAGQPGSDPAGPAPDDTAYLLYTSGSTGRPKAVRQTHRNLLAQAGRYARVLDVEPSDTVGLLASVSFDASLMDLFGGLLRGACVRTFDPRSEDLTRLPTVARASGMTVLHVTPTVFRTLARTGRGESWETIRAVVLGGEPVRGEDVAFFDETFPSSAVLLNLYGASEHSFSLGHLVDRGLRSSEVPAGSPVGDVDVLLLDAGGREDSVLGELVIRSRHNAPGYGAPGRGDGGGPADPFSPDPSDATRSLYRTGDLARRRPDGLYVVLGRLDGQVKVRGHRVETGEVETALRRHPDVAEVGVHAPTRPDGERVLTACYVPRPGSAVDGSTLAGWLLEFLPRYMVPTTWVVLDALPRTPSGKVDRRALPTAGEADRPEGGQGPRNPTEERIAAIWRDVLGVEEVGVFDDFFESGGHSLRAVEVMARIRSAFGVDLPLRVMFDRPTVAGIADWLASREDDAPDQLPLRRLAGNTGPLSFAQERVWIFQELEPGSTTYNVTPVMHLRGACDVARLSAALEAVVERHEPLRSTVVQRGDEVVQQAGSVPPGLLRVRDLGAADAGSEAGEGKDSAIQAIVHGEHRVPFDLHREIPIRALLLRLHDAHHVLVVTFHHLAVDGTSVQLFFQELEQTYLGRTVKALPVRYRDHAAWEREVWSDDHLDAGLGFWREYLDGAPPVLDFPRDRPRPERAVYTAGVAGRTLTGAEAGRVHTLARSEGASLFMVLLAALGEALHRHTGQRDLVVGTPVSGRRRPEVQDLVGMFINQLPVRLRVAPRGSFRDLLREARASAMTALSHQDMPFPRLVEALVRDHDTSRTPLFQVLLNVLPVAAEEVPAEAGELRFVKPDVRELSTLVDLQAKFDFTLYALERGGELHLGLVYNQGLFEASRMEGLVSDVAALLRAAIDDPDRTLDAIPGAERTSSPWKRTLGDAGRQVHEASVPERFGLVADRSPEAPAVSGPGAEWTYGQLAGRALDIARSVAAATADAPDGPVGVVVPHGPEAIAALLGVLRSGRPYVPLDPSYPRERLAFMVEDAGIRTILTTVHLQEQAVAMLPHDGSVVTLDTLPPADAPVPPMPSPDAVAYLLYTSGSTGRPKAVVQTHRRLLRQASRYRDALSIGPGDRLAWTSSISFDASLMDVFGGVTAGATVCPVDPRSLDLGALAEAFSSGGATVLHLTPTVFRALLRSGGVPAYPAVRAVVLGGEPVRARDVEGFDRHFREDALLFNLYGASENSFSLGTPIDRNSRGNEIPLGWPVGDVEVELLDPEGRPDPVQGEMVLRSRDGVEAYWRAPELSAGTFHRDPNGARGVLYRTGDIVRRSVDGGYVFLHRADAQMKVRGHRIEAYEVESALLAHGSLAEVAVHAPPAADGEPALVACLVPTGTGAPPSVAELSAWCASRLPSFMVPSGWVFLDRLPRTPSGKVDRRSLPAAPPAPSPDASRPAPLDAVEVELFGIWSEALRSPVTGRRDRFFEMGGHSLAAMQVVARVRDVFGVDLPLRRFFDHSTLEATAEWIREHRGGATLLPPMVRVPGLDEAPLSFSQERLWFLQQMDPGASAYNMAIASLVEGPLDVERLREAMNQVALRQESLRTRFRQVGGRAVQVVEAEPNHTFELAQVGKAGAEEQLLAARTFVEEKLGAPYDLEKGPLCRVVVVRMDAHRHIVGFGTHHTVSDLWSYGILGREVRAAYAGEALEPLPVRYRDHAVWQRAWLQGEALDDQIAYWREQLSGVPALELATDLARPAFFRYEGRVLRRGIPDAVADRLRRFAVEHGVTPFMTLLASFNALLAAWSGQEDIAVGVPIAGRRASDIQDVIGVFVNTLVHRNDLSGDPSFRELVARVRATALDAYAHQDAPVELLVRELEVERDTSRSPLFQVLFNVADMRMDGLGLPGLQQTVLPLERGGAQFDLGMNVGLNELQSEVQLTYNTSLFTQATAERLLDHYLVILDRALGDPDRGLTELGAPVEEDRRLLVEDWNATSGDRSTAQALPELVAAAGRRTPGAEAVVSPSGSFTYAELLDYAGRVTGALQAMGVRPGDRVAILMERTREMVGALLGIAGAGAAYVPVDPGYPEARVRFMLDDSGAVALVSHRGLERRLEPATPVLDLDRWTPPPPAPFVPSSPERAAYVIYTSGSTGQPKGVEVPHGAVTNFLLAMADRPGLTAADTLLAVTTISFDIAVLELYLPLVVGARVWIAGEDEVVDGRRLMRSMEAGNVSVMQATPATWKLLLSAGWEGNPSLRVLCGGEALPAWLAEDLLGRVGELWNMYGPTETTVWSTVERVAPGDPILVGRPIRNTTLYVLGESLELRPVGVPGELYIGGAGVALGYVNRPDLTAERFIDSPFVDGERLYRTGDLVRYRSDGRLEHLGRLDHQVKVRGFRIELGEVESALRAHPAVQDAVVTATDDRLVGYVVFEAGMEATPGELRGWVGDSLPAYMVPGSVTPLDALPLTPNGKVDRKRLPEPAAAGFEDVDDEEPLDPSARIIADVWSELLGVDRVGLNDNFFEIGGHSLLAMEAVALVEERTGHRLEPRALFLRNLGELAAALPDSVTTAPGGRSGG